MIKTIIFDAFDTLFEVEKCASANYILGRIAEQVGKVAETEFFRLWKDYYRENTASNVTFRTEREIFTSRIQMLYDKYGVLGDATADANIIFYKAIERRTFDDVLPILSFLQGKYNIFIGSNTDNDALSAVMKNNDISVDKVYTSENLQCYKPMERFYRVILEENNLLCDEVLFVGDSIVDDVLGPQKVNVKTCWLNRNGKQRTTVIPDYEIQSLTELVRILK